MVSFSRQGSLKRTSVAVGIAAALVIAGPAVALAARHGRSAREQSRWVATWATAPDQPGSTGISAQGFQDQTLRMVVHVSVGGQRLRLHFSDLYSPKALDIGVATVAVQGFEADTASGTVQPVTFAGASGTVVPAGKDVVSDPVALSVPDEANLLVSVYLPDATGPTTWHPDAQEVNYVASGNHAADASGSAFSEQSLGPLPVPVGGSWFYLDAIDASGCGCDGSVVEFGDSITDGFHSTIDANTRWPDYFGERLLRRRDRWGIANEGIGGNAVVTNGSTAGSFTTGPAATARFLHDAAQAGVRDVIFLEGINDIGVYGTGAQQIIAGMRQVIRDAHALHLRIYGGTLTPFEGATYTSASGGPYYTPAKELTRQAVNRFIRTGRAFDGVIDFDKALRNPVNPLQLRPIYDSGDHLHPNDAGYRAMANAVPLSLLR